MSYQSISIPSSITMSKGKKGRKQVCNNTLTIKRDRMSNRTHSRWALVTSRSTGPAASAAAAGTSAEATHPLPSAVANTVVVAAAAAEA